MKRSLQHDPANRHIFENSFDLLSSLPSLPSLLSPKICHFRTRIYSTQKSEEEETDDEIFLTLPGRKESRNTWSTSSVRTEGDEEENISHRVTPRMSSSDSINSISQIEVRVQCEPEYIFKPNLAVPQNSINLFFSLKEDLSRSTRVTEAQIGLEYSSTSSLVNRFFFRKTIKYSPV